MQLIIQRQAPYSGQSAYESLDLALAFAVMDVDCALLFADEGVWQLLQQQSPSAQKNLAKNFAALPMYGIEKLYVDADSLAVRGIAVEDLITNTTVIDAATSAELIASASGVFAL